MDCSKMKIDVAQVLEARPAVGGRSAIRVRPRSSSRARRASPREWPGDAAHRVGGDEIDRDRSPRLRTRSIKRAPEQPRHRTDGPEACSTPRRPGRPSARPVRRREGRRRCGHPRAVCRAGRHEVGEPVDEVRVVVVLVRRHAQIVLVSDISRNSEISARRAARRCATGRFRQDAPAAAREGRNDGWRWKADGRYGRDATRRNRAGLVAGRAPYARSSRPAFFAAGLDGTRLAAAVSGKASLYRWGWARW